MIHFFSHEMDQRCSQKEVCRAPTHVVHGDGSFDYHEANFVLFGVTAEEIRWLLSGVVVPHVTVRPRRRSRHPRARRVKFDRLAFLNTELLIRVPCSDENNALGSPKGF